MAKDSFANAPSGTGGIRGISRQIAGVLGVTGSLGGGGSKTNYRQQAALQNQQHTQNVQRDVVKHVLGETAADKAHKRTLSQGRQAHKLGQKAADAAHVRDKESATHLIDHFERLGSSNQFSNLNVGAKGISGTFRAPESSDNITTSPTTTNAPSSGSVNLDD